MSRKLILAGAGLLAAILLLPLFAGRGVTPAPERPQGSSISREELVLPRPVGDGWERLVSLEGEGEKRSPFTTQGGQIRIEWSARGAGDSQQRFEIQVLDGESAVATPVQATVGDRTGNVNVELPEGNYTLHVTGDNVTYRVQVYDRVLLN